MLGEFKQAFTRPNNGHTRLIIINVSVFVVLGLLYVISSIGGFPEVFELIHKQFSIPPKLMDFAQRPWTILTYAFTHSLSDIFHILFNMLVLYWFGRLMMEYLGSAKLIALYILGAIAAAIVYLTVFNTIPFFQERSDFSGMVGASGAVFAVMVGVSTLLPDYAFHLLFLGRVKIKYIAAFYVVISVLGSVGGNAGGNVAHLGGALMGFIYIKQLKAGVDWGAWITSFLDWIPTLFEPKKNVKVTYRKKASDKRPPRQQASEATSQEEIDRILDKISSGGYESLTREEKDRLFNASK